MCACILRLTRVPAGWRFARVARDWYLSVYPSITPQPALALLNSRGFVTNVAAVAAGNAHACRHALQVSWRDGPVAKFHAAWLRCGGRDGARRRRRVWPARTPPATPALCRCRDHCQCVKCYNAPTRQRLLDTASAAPAALAITSAAARADGDVAVEWGGGHRSVFASAFLKANMYWPVNAAGEAAAAAARGARAVDLTHVSHAVPWDPTLFGQPGPDGLSLISALPGGRFSDIVSSDAALLGWMKLVRRHGFAMVRWW